MVDRIEKLRKIFNRKIQELMDKHGYVDIDEGEYEAITEREEGFIRFWDREGRIYTYIYYTTENDVIIEPMFDYEGII